MNTKDFFLFYVCVIWLLYTMGKWGPRSENPRSLFHFQLNFNDYQPTFVFGPHDRLHEKT